MAELVFDVVIDDNVDFSVADDFQVEVQVIEENLTVVELPGPVGPQGPPGPNTNILTAVLYQEEEGQTVYSLPVPALDYTKIIIYRNGLLEVPGYSFYLSGEQIVFTTAPLPDDVMVASYAVAQD